MVDAFTASADAPCGAAACNLFTQAPCMNKKCTWIVDDAEPGDGHVGCVFPGATPIGVACTRDAFGADSCVSGTTCYQDRCRTICDLQSAPDFCGTQLTCRETALFHMCASPTVLAGLCLP
jgi:hypothetical protein